MALTRPDSRQIINRGALGNIGAAAGTTQDSLNSKFNTEVNSPLRLAATFPTADSKLNFTASLVAAADGAQKAMPPVSSQVFDALVAATIDFQTQTISAPSQFTITWPSPNNVGQFRKAGFTLTAAGTIQVLFSAEAASEGALADAGTLTVTGIPLGYINLQCTNASGFFKTAGSGTNIIENAKIFRFGTGGGAGSSGSGSGTGDDLDSLLFRASFNDGFDEIPSSTNSAVDVTAAHTDATAYSAAKTLYQLNYDASKTIAAATTTTTINLSSNAAFTVKTGDMVISGSQARRITAVGSQSSFTVDAFDVAPTLASQVTVSQAVHTKDIYNLAVDGSALSAAFSGATFSEVMVDYEDTTTVADSIFDVNVAPVIAFSASHNGTSFTNNQVRPTLETTTIASVALSAAGTSLYLRFFANKTSGSGSVNILRYKAFMQKDANAATGGATGVTAWSAIAFSDHTGTPVNCTIGEAGGKSVITLTNGLTYAVGANSGSPYGTLDVFLNGQLIPRFINSTITPDGSYTETSPTIITLNRDYSSQNLSIEVLLRSAVIDTTSQNVSAIAALQEQDLNGFQGFVNQSALMSATSTAGTPVAGTFYSTITGRASIVDLSQDLKVRMGIERITTQNIYELQNEFGPNGEQVFGTSNDLFGQVRFVGSWATVVDTGGARAKSTVNGDYVEVTFYGTGLNFVSSRPYAAAATDFRASVDGGSEGADLIVQQAGVISDRNYSSNIVIPMVSGLTLGVHTVKFRVANNADNMHCEGFEILNESASLKVQPGTSYLAGKKLVLSSQLVVSPSTTFDTGTLGTAGGRVVVYQKADGTIGKAVQPTGGQANLTSANHANEELVRTYWPREFGAGRNDDFSGNLSLSSYAFTLEDGTTTLIGSSVRMGSTATLSEVVQIAANGGFITFVFVGTGLDVVRQDDGSGTDSYSYSVDGTSIGTVNTSTSGPRTVEKVVSGLPYGTHVVKLLRTSAPNSSRALARFMVYQPKKPAIPTGAVELADYNVMANFVANSTTGGTFISTGVLRKTCVREFTYVQGTGGTQDWAAEGPQGGSSGGNQMDSTRTNAFFDYVFFGTGFDFRYSADTNRSASITVSLQSLTTGGSLQTLNSTNFPGLTTSSYGGTFTYASGNLTQVAGATTPGSGMVVSGLTLGLYKVRFNNNTASSFITVESFDIITPVHATKTNLFSDLQNSLPVGSCAISDNRKTTILKEALPSQKPWVQAFGITSDPTTTVNAATPMPDMFLVIRTFGNPIEVAYSTEIQNASTGNNSITYLYVDGVQVGVQKDCNTPSAGARFQTNDNQIVPVGPGVHTVAVYWQAAAGTLSATGARRNMKARET